MDYDDKLTSAGDLDKNHLRPESQSLSYSNTSPKLGAVYQLNDNHNVYLSYKHAFRAPTVGTLFRSGSSVNTTELEPVTSVSTEVGFRGNFDYQLNYEIALYDMETENDIVSVINGNSREVANAGKTSHKGIEIGLDAPLSDSFQLGISYTYTEQKYEDFAFNYFTRDCFCRREINFAGNDVAKAPKNQANIRLAYAPIYLDGFRSEIEWTDLGSYYINQTNTEQYDGHSLINWRNSYDLNDRVTFSFRITNLTDERYSTSTSNQVGSDVISYRPGAPRSIFAGIRASF